MTWLIRHHGRNSENAHAEVLTANSSTNPPPTVLVGCRPNRNQDQCISDALRTASRMQPDNRTSGPVLLLQCNNPVFADDCPEVESHLAEPATGDRLTYSNCVKHEVVRVACSGPYAQVTGPTLVDDDRPIVIEQRRDIR